MSPRVAPKRLKKQNFFRPDPVLPPRLGTTFDEYKTYLECYTLYTTFQKSSRVDFWVESKAKVERKPYKIPHVEIPIPLDSTEYTIIQIRNDGRFIADVKEASLHTDKSMAGQQKLANDLARGTKLVYKVIPIPRTLHPVIKTEVVHPAPAPVQEKVQLSEARLAQKKANQTAKRRRHRAARASRDRAKKVLQLQQTTKVVDARFACEKVQNKFESWTKVVSKTSKKRQARASALAAKSLDKVAPASRPPWYPVDQASARLLAAKWDGPKS